MLCVLLLCALLEPLQGPHVVACGIMRHLLRLAESGTTAFARREDAFATLTLSTDNLDTNIANVLSLAVTLGATRALCSGSTRPNSRSSEGPNQTRYPDAVVAPASSRFQHS